MPYPLAAPPPGDWARELLVWILAVTFAVAIPMRVRGHRRGGPIDRSPEGKVMRAVLRPLGLATAVLIVLHLVAPARMAWATLGVPSALRGVGVLLVLSGCILQLLVFRHLGANLTDTVTTRATHTLVTHGPYRVVRHPLYVAVALDILGFCLATGAWLPAITGTAVIMLLIARTRTEERLLVARFGTAYTDYMARVGGFLPRFRGRSGASRRYRP